MTGKPRKHSTPKTSRSTIKAEKAFVWFPGAERAATKEPSEEFKEKEHTGKRNSKEEAETDASGNSAEMAGPDHSMAKRIHEIEKAYGPFTPKTRYEMPAYVKEREVACFFRSADRFGPRYAALGFNDTASLDVEAMTWPVNNEPRIRRKPLYTNVRPASHLLDDLSVVELTSRRLLNVAGA